MLSIRWILMVAAGLIVWSCGPATSPERSTPAAPAPTTPAPVAMIDLPCAETDPSGGPAIAYPNQSLYRSGSVFPSEEGLTCLSILADWLKTAPVQSWDVSVSGEEGFGFDATKLAEKRRELLQRYFQRKGIETAAWQWQAQSGGNSQLRFKGRP